MRINKGRAYLLHWRNNPSVWNDDLKELKRTKKVILRNGKYYTKVVPHYTGDFYMVDCTCDNKGNSYPIISDLLKEI